MSNNPKTNPIVFFFRESWLLMAASVIFGCLLAGLNTLWEPEIIKRQQEKFNTLAGGLLSEAKDFTEAANINGTTVMKGIDADGNPVGWAFVCEGSGFADKIKLVIAVDTPFKEIVGFGVLSSMETVGYGDAINQTGPGSFQSQFRGAPVGPLTLSKTGDVSTIDSKIVSISGATVTSTAVIKIFNTTLEPIKEAMQKQGLIP